MITDYKLQRGITPFSGGLLLCRVVSGVSLFLRNIELYIVLMLTNDKSRYQYDLLNKDDPISNKR